jgi:hypothetical protein
VDTKCVVTNPIGFVLEWFVVRGTWSNSLAPVANGSTAPGSLTVHGQLGCWDRIPWYGSRYTTFGAGNVDTSLLERQT